MTSLSVIRFISAAGGGVEWRKCYPDPRLWSEITKPVKHALWPGHCVKILLSIYCSSQVYTVKLVINRNILLLIALKLQPEVFSAYCQGSLYTFSTVRGFITVTP